MVQQIFDLSAIRRFRTRALRCADAKAAFLLKHASAEAAERLSFVDRTFERAAFTSGNAAFVSPEFLSGTRHSGARFLSGFSDPEIWPSAGEEALNPALKDLDLALSLLSLHETNDTPGALTQIRLALKPDGLFLGVMPGAGTLGELRHCLTLAETEIAGGAAPRVHPFVDVRTAGTLLQRAGFAMPVADEESVTVRYPDMFALMRDLRLMGASNALCDRSRKPPPRSLFLRAAAIYREKFADPDGRIRATFNFLWMSGWSPSANQQGPARRGSGTMPLAEVLDEIGRNG